MSRPRWDEIAGEAIAAAREVAARIRAGRLDPPDPDACSHWCRCEYLWR